MRINSFFLASMVILAACGGSTSTVATGDSDSPEIGCENGPWFPQSALDEIPPIEDSGLTGLEEGMASFLSSGEGDFWPQDGWRVLHSTDDEVLLVHNEPADSPVPGFSFMMLEGTDGAWTWAGASGAGPCLLVTRPDPSSNTVNWQLDPGFAVPGPQDTTLHLLATELECVSGVEMGDRLQSPAVLLSGNEILITLSADSPGGDQDCPGNPSTPVTIELDEPLGGRAVVDGRTTGMNLSDFMS